MDTKLQYYGQLRHAAHCGMLYGRHIYYIESDGRTAIVLRSLGTADQASPIFCAALEDDIEEMTEIEWADNDAAHRARAWAANSCRVRGEKLVCAAAKLVCLAAKLRGEVSPS
jgi:hypothetical protein